MTTIQKLKDKKHVLEEEQKNYDYTIENREVERLNEQLNDAVSRLNVKKNMFDKFEKDIKQVDEIIHYIENVE